MSDIKRKRRSVKKRTIYIWTWIADFSEGRKGYELCRFAESTKKILLQQGKPCPGAVPVRVRLSL